MQDYHWFTETIEELTKDAYEANSDILLLGLSSVIDTFAKEANLPIEDREKLSDLQSSATTRPAAKGAEKIKRLRTCRA